MGLVRRGCSRMQRRSILIGMEGGVGHLAKIGMSYFFFILVDESMTSEPASKNHRHSRNNPYSQFRDGWSEEQVANAPKINNQLTKFMCSPTSDGG